MHERRHEDPVFHGLARVLPHVTNKIRFDIQAGRIHDVICRILADAGRPVPKSSWHRVQLCIAKTVSASPKKITPHSWLIEELGFD
jgi:hypothetical protein